MSLQPTVLIKLGMAVAKATLKIWLKDSTIDKEISYGLFEALDKKFGDVKIVRPTARLFDRIADRVAEEMEPFFAHETAGLADGDKEVVVSALVDTLTKTPITDELLFSSDLDPSALESHLNTIHPATKMGLTTSGEILYAQVLNEACHYLVELATTLPGFQYKATRELLKREEETLSLVEKILENLPKRADELKSTNSKTFETQYRRRVARKLDEIELFGISLFNLRRRYNLTTAYVSLSMEDREEFDEDRQAYGKWRVEDAFGKNRKILIRGDPGSGKTTLLQWLAVQAARRTFPEQLVAWNSSIPFFIRLRSYVGEELPEPARFLEQIARPISSAMPRGWVHRYLEQGTALVLIDGVDEVPAKQRDAVRDWIDDLVNEFPKSRFIVTSRRAAVEDNWLSGLQFRSYELRPMGNDDTRTFVHHWHMAAGKDIANGFSSDDLARYEMSLTRAIRNHYHIRQLATNPLLCAIICAINVDRKAQLPTERSDLYRVALDTLLERRDAERQIGLYDHLAISRGAKESLLQQVAYWLLVNDFTDVDYCAYEERMGRIIEKMQHVKGTTEEVSRYLLERSGVLCEPSVRRVNFIHRTFQEYLAAKWIAEEDCGGILIEKASNDQWQEVVTLFGGLAQRSQVERLVMKLIELGDNGGNGQHRCYILAAACVAARETIAETVTTAINSRLELIVPPDTIEKAKLLAAAGPACVPHLKGHADKAPEIGAACVHALALIGDTSALLALKEYAQTTNPVILREVVGAWDYFDQMQYSEEVLTGCDFPGPLVWRDKPSLNGINVLVELRTLDCHGNESLEDLAPLAELPKLEELDLTGCSGIISVGPLRKLKALRTLKLNGVEAVDNLRVLKGMSTIEHLELNGCIGIKSLKSISTLKNIRVLCVSGCFELSDISPLSGLMGLEELNLGGCYGIDSLGALRLLPRLKKLTIADRKLIDELDSDLEDRVTVEYE